MVGREGEGGFSLSVGLTPWQPGPARYRFGAAVTRPSFSSQRLTSIVLWLVLCQLCRTVRELCHDSVCRLCVRGLSVRLNIIYALSLSPSLSEVGGGAQNQLMRPLVGLRWIQGERKRQKSVSGILKFFHL